jgi:hypothetical protein
MLINALRRGHSSVEPGGTAAVVRRAIYVAMFSEQNQQLVPLIPCGTTPRGGVKFYRLFPSGPRGRLSFATSPFLPKCPFSAKVQIMPLPTD